MTVDNKLLDMIIVFLLKKGKLSFSSKSDNANFTFCSLPPLSEPAL